MVHCAGSSTWGKDDMRPCQSRGTLGYNGQCYCHVHHPPTMQARKEGKAVTEREMRRRAAMCDDLIMALRPFVQAFEAWEINPQLSAQNRCNRQDFERARNAFALHCIPTKSGVAQ